MVNEKRPAQDPDDPINQQIAALKGHSVRHIGKQVGLSAGRVSERLRFMRAANGEIKDNPNDINSPTSLRIAELVRAGWTDEAIAGDVNWSVQTVKRRIGIMRSQKVKLPTRSERQKLAAERSWQDPTVRGNRSKALSEAANTAAAIERERAKKTEQMKEGSPFRIKALDALARGRQKRIEKRKKKS